jgi:hypothetical protein
MLKQNANSKKIAKNISMIVSRKAIFYTLDALLASMLLLGSILMFYYIYDPVDSTVEQQTFVSQDILIVLSELRVSELNNSFINQEIASGNITDTNKTVLDQVGEYWALNKVDKAQEMLQIIINDSIPPSQGVRTSMGNNTLLLRNISSKTNSVSYNRMIAGIEQGKPLTGSSGTSYLKKIQNKKTSSYAYFGGFVGQGNITILLNLPSDFNSSRLISSSIKLETPGTFKVYINSNLCGTNYSGKSSGNSSSVSLIDITFCNSSFKSGANNISLNYISSLNTSYVSGGFIKVTYTTDLLMENNTAGYYRYYFPSIVGFINLYDAISVQGLIKNWTLNVTYDSPYSTFLTLGNETVFIDPGQNSTRNIFITKTNLSIPLRTIPLRMAHTNLSNITILEEGLPSDSMLITDVSGSMSDCAVYVNRSMCQYDYKQYSWWWFTMTTSCQYNGSCSGNVCGISPIYSISNQHLVNQSVCSKTLLDVAKEADKLFVSTILNVSTMHRIGLEDFSVNGNTPTNLTNVKSVLDSEIDSYTPDSGTCTCCGINRARNLINSSANKKFMIVLSDGEPNYYCSNFNDYTGTSGSTAVSAAWAINASKLACQNNITVFAIGFGTAMTSEGHSIMRQIACNASLYFNATNTSQLTSIYKNITESILISANFSSQTVNIQGTFNTTKLYPDSYIDVYYDDLNSIDMQNKLSVVLESEQFNGCNNTISIPAGITVQDAYVTSYSSNHWTKTLSINNNNVFNLTEYGTSYDLLGDPFVLQIPAPLLLPGQANTISLSVGDTPNNNSICSSNNSLIYTALISASTQRTDAYEKAIGCKWIIESSTGSLMNFTIPKSYSGSNVCRYTSSQIVYDGADVYDVSVYTMLRQLDYEQDGTIFFDLTQNDLEIILITTGQIAYMWGPSLMNIEVWK